MGPHARETRQPVLQLGQFDLELALTCIGMLGEDVENERRPVDHLDVLAKDGLQFALVPRRKLVVEEHHIRLQFIDERLHLFHLARADIGGAIGFIEALDGLTDDVNAGRIGQQCKLFQTGFRR